MKVKNTILAVGIISILIAGIGSNMQYNAYALDKRLYDIVNNHVTPPSSLKDLTTKGDITAYVQSVNPQSREHKSNLFDVVVKVIAGKTDSSNEKITIKSDMSSSTFSVPQLKSYESRIIHVGLTMKNPSSVRLLL